VKPEEGVSAQARRAVPTSTPADSDVATAASLTLGDNTLTLNLGIPIVVVLTKVCTAALLIAISDRDLATL